MFSIKYKNQFIDILPNQLTEYKSNNPLYLLDDVLGEYSNPVNIKYSEKNWLLLGPLFADSSIKQKIKLAVEVHEFNSFSYNATLVIDKSFPDRKFVSGSYISGFLLSGISSFFSKMRNKKANTLQLGGLRSIAYTTDDPLDSSNGWVQAFQATWENEDDYVVAPVRNDAWWGDFDDIFSTGWMNKLDNAGNLITDSILCLFPRVKYVLVEALREGGFIVDHSAMTGTDWDKLFLFSVKPLETYSFDFVLGSVKKNPIEFRLADFISPEIDCNNLILSLCKKYGWALVFNNRTVRIVPIKNGLSGNVVDFTAYASRRFESDFRINAKIFEFKNNFPNNDEAVKSADNSGATIGNPVVDVSDLPTPSGMALDNTIIYVYNENKYYKIEFDDTTSTRKWVEAYDNIYNLEKENATTTYESNVTTLPIVWSKYRTASGVDYYGYFAYCKQSQFKNWGIRTLLFLGMVKELKEDRTEGLINYPYLSSIRTAPNGTDVLPWSNVYSHVKAGIDYGIVPYWFSKWNKINGLTEIIEEELTLPFNILKNFSFDKIVNIYNIPYLMVSYVKQLPYKDKVRATLQRVQLSEVAPNVPGVLIYIKITAYDTSFEASRSSSEYFPAFDVTVTTSYTNLTVGKFKVETFADAAGTIPTIVSNLTVKLRQTTQWTGSSVNNFDFDIVLDNVNSKDAELFPGAGTEWVISADVYEATSVPPSIFEFSYSDYLQDVSILADAAYVII